MKKIFEFLLWAGTILAILFLSFYLSYGVEL